MLTVFLQAELEALSLEGTVDELALLARLEGGDEDPTQAVKPTMMGKDMRQLIMSGQGPQALQLWKVGPCQTAVRFLGSSLSFGDRDRQCGRSCSHKGALAHYCAASMCRGVQAVHVLFCAGALRHAKRAGPQGVALLVGILLPTREKPQNRACLLGTCCRSGAGCSICIMPWLSLLVVCSL